MLLLLNASILPPPKTAQDSVTDTIGLKKRNSVSAASVDKAQNLEQLRNLFQKLAPDLQLKIAQNIPMTYKNAQKFASQNYAHIDWAFQFSDPSMDGYALLEQWKKLEDPEQIQALTEKMMKNSKYKNILEWEKNHGLEFTRSDNYHNSPEFQIATSEGNTDIIEYWILKKGFKPTYDDLILTIKKGKTDIFKLLVEKGNYTPDYKLLSDAIVWNFKNQYDIIEYLLKQDIKPRQLDLFFAFKPADKRMYDLLAKYVNLDWEAIPDYDQIFINEILHLKLVQGQIVVVD